MLVRHPSRVFSRLQLMEAALGDYYEGYERTIDSHVSHLRRKLEPDPSRPRYLRTEPGMGYRFTAADSEVSPPGGRSS